MSPPRHRVQTERIDYSVDYDSGLHSHEEHQFSYAKSGAFTIDVDDFRWVVPPLRAVWIPAGVNHVLRSTGAAIMHPVYVRSDLREVSEVTVFGITSLVRSLIDELHDQTDQNPKERYHLEELFLLQLDRLAAQPLQLPRLRDPRLVAIQAELDRFPSDGRTLKEWGRFCGASERTLVRLFTSEANTSFGQWRTQLRLHHGLLLLSDAKSVTETAHRVGYSSTSAFIEAFRIVFGTTPGRYFKAG